MSTDVPVGADRPSLAASDSCPTARAAATPPRGLSPETKVSIVIPCYNEEAVLPLLFERLSREAALWGTDYEVILVDDGSVDRTWEILLDFHRRDPRWKLIRFARNFGHQTALRAGLFATTGELVAVLDADLQDPPEVLPQFFAKWSEGYDVIYGVRRTRREGIVMRSAYHWFYRLLSLVAENHIPLHAGDFSVMDRRIVDLLKQMPEQKPFIRGLRSWLGFRQVALPYDRDARAAGRTKYNMGRLFGLALDGILSSSILPLRLATWFGACVSLLAFLGAVLILVMRLMEQHLAAWGIATVPGTATIVISILFLGGVQLLCLGILGEYLGRIYENVKGRPFWTVIETHGVAEQAIGLEDSRAGSRSKLASQSLVEAGDGTLVPADPKHATRA